MILKNRYSKLKEGESGPYDERRVSFDLILPSIKDQKPKCKKRKLNS
jgi:hypothetical protein